MKIVRESKSESFRIPPQNENCHRVQVREFQNTEYPLNENCQRVQVREFQNTPPPQSFRIPISEYQWETMCGKLPHVETLSNPDNYSFFYCVHPGPCPCPVLGLVQCVHQSPLIKLHGSNIFPFTNRE